MKIYADPIKGWFHGLLLATMLLTGCTNFRQDVSELDLTGEMSADPNNPDATQVTVGGKIYFRDPGARRLPNYSK